MRTGIIIITFNIDTRIFILQVEAIRKFCKDDFTIEIIDNSTDKEKAEAIKYHARILKVNYRKTLANTKDSSGSHSFAANLSYQILKDTYDLFFYLDHDCIPIAPFSCEEILKGKLMAGLIQAKTKIYFWPGCFLFKKEVEPIDFSFNRDFQLDTGGNLYQLIEKYGEETCVFFSEEYRQMDSGDNNYFSVIAGIFWHCIAASGWSKIPHHNQRINSFINVVTQQ